MHALAIDSDRLSVDCASGTSRHRTLTAVVASESMSVRSEYRDAMAQSEGFRLIGESTWCKVLDLARHLQPGIVILDAPTESLCRAGEIVDQLDAIDRRPMIALLVQPQSFDASILGSDIVLAANVNAGQAMDALRLLTSGAVVEMVHPARRNLFGGLDPVARQRISTLTDREREILGLVVEGLSNREVGEQLYISADTVKEHVSRILAKLQVASRIEAAVVAVRADLLTA